MMLSFLPNDIYTCFSNYKITDLNEIRLRLNQPVICFKNNQRYFLSKKGLVKNVNDAIHCTSSHIDAIINKVTENSIYAFNEKIINGYITTKQGVRIGICGECVFYKNKITTIKNFTSLCIRIPHSIIGCSNYLFNKLYQKKVYSTLILSAPGGGKTTIIKDLIRNFDEKYNLNILVVDERGELIQEGKNIDVIKYADKQYALNYSIRSLSPQIIFLDEISSNEDFNEVKKAVESGIMVICTAHADSIENIYSKMPDVNKVFDYFVVLDGYFEPGRILGIYNKKFYEI